LDHPDSDGEPGGWERVAAWSSRSPR
jgi:hypothetical protein